MSQDPETRPQSLFLRFLHTLSSPILRPEPDEKRFLVGLAVVQALIIYLWGKGLFGFLGAYPIVANVAFWSIAYILKFRKRLQARRELGRVILLSLAFTAFLLSIVLY